jgi:hypothetical protein
MADLTLDLKKAALDVLDQLIQHNIKGADYIKKGILIIDDIVDHRNELLEILNAIKPFIMSIWEKIKEWLQTAYSHLVALWEWCVEAWHDLVGKKSIN